jgi:hypothetical protein
MKGKTTMKRKSAATLESENNSLQRTNSILHACLRSQLDSSRIAAKERINGQTWELIEPTHHLGGVVFVRTGSRVDQYETLDALIRFFQDWVPYDTNDDYCREMLAKREIVSRFQQVRHSMLFPKEVAA